MGPKASVITKCGSALAGTVACAVGIIQLYQWAYPPSPTVQTTPPSAQTFPEPAPSVRNELYSELSNKTLAAKHVDQTLDVPIQFLGLTDFSTNMLPLPEGYTYVHHFEPRGQLPLSPFGSGPPGFGMVPPFAIVATAALAAEMIKLPIPAEITVHGKLVSKKANWGSENYLSVESFRHTK